MMASADMSMSASVVATEVMERRITQSPCHEAPPAKQTPPACTAAITFSVWACAFDGIAFAEIDDQLIDRHVVPEIDAGFGGKAGGHLFGQRAMALDHPGDAVAAERFQHAPRPGCRGRDATARARRPRARGRLRDGRQVARPLRHGALVRLAVAHDGEAGIVRRLQPLMAVGHPGIGAFDARGQMLQRRRGAGPEAEGAVDMYPGAGGLGDRDDRRERS